MVFWEEWQLFIDESGNFDSSEGLRLVTGLLLRAPDSPEIRDLLRRGVEWAHSSVSWPPHASHLRKTTGWILESLKRKSTGPQSGELTQAAQRLFGHLKQKFPEAAKKIEQVINGYQLGPKEYGILEKQLKELDPSYLEPFHLARLHLTERMNSIFCYLNQDAEAVTLVSVVGDSDKGDAYVRALRALLERVVALFRQNPRSDASTTIKIRVHVAQRHISLFDGMETERMVLWHIQTICDQMRRCPPHGQTRKQDSKSFLSFIASGIWDANHDPNCHPGLVLADYISYRAYCSLRDLGKEELSTLGVLSSSFHSRVSLPLERIPRLDSKALPTLAATGRAREAILDAYLPEGKQDPLTDLKPTWMAEQSVAWQQFARRFPREEEET